MLIKNAKKQKSSGVTRVKLISHSRRVDKKVERDLYWYDHNTKKMKKYRGTRLTYEYDRNEKKTIARPVTEEMPVYRNSWEDILAIIEKHKRHLDVVGMYRGNYAILEIEDDYFWYDIKKQLRKLSIRYEIDDEDNEDNSRDS